MKSGGICSTYLDSTVELKALQSALGRGVDTGRGVEVIVEARPHDRTLGVALGKLFGAQEDTGESLDGSRHLGPLLVQSDGSGWIE